MMRFMKSRHASCVALVLMSLDIEAAAQTAASAPPAITPASSLLHVFVGLVIVLLLLVGVAWLLRRMGALQQPGGGTMRVLGTVAVGQRERIVLIEVAGTWLLVGVAPGSVSALHNMPKGHEVQTNASAAAPASSFAFWMKRFSEGGRS